MKKLIFSLMLLVVLGLARPGYSCPMCKDTIAQNSTTQPMDTGGVDATGLGGGFNNSVFVMLGGFMAVLGLVGFGMVKAVRGTPVSRRSN